MFCTAGDHGFITMLWEARKNGIQVMLISRLTNTSAEYGQEQDTIRWHCYWGDFLANSGKQDTGSAVGGGQHVSLQQQLAKLSALSLPAM